MAAEPRNVVVGCDGSWQSDLAVAAAAREAGLRRCPLVIVSVLADRDLLADRLSDMAEREADALERAVARAKRGRDRARAVDPDLEVRMVTTMLDSRELTRVAAAADLLALGGQGTAGGRAFALGTVSGELARLFPVPILVPRLGGGDEQEDRSRRSMAVLVGIDGRGTDLELLAVGVHEAWLRHVGLLVVRAIPARGADASTEWAMTDSWRLVRHVEPPDGMPVRVVLSGGEPALALVHEAQPEDLLVLGTRGGGRLAGLVSDSVARRVLDASPCDVLVVPPGHGAAWQRRDLAAARISAG